MLKKLRPFFWGEKTCFLGDLIQGEKGELLAAQLKDFGGLYVYKHPIGLMNLSPNGGFRLGNLIFIAKNISRWVSFLNSCGFYPET